MHNRLRGDAGTGGADVGTGTAILALGGVDDIDAVPFGDGVLWTFGFAGAAGNAVRSDFVGHECFLS